MILLTPRSLSFAKSEEFSRIPNLNTVTQDIQNMFYTSLGMYFLFTVYTLCIFCVFTVCSAIHLVPTSIC